MAMKNKLLLVKNKMILMLFYCLRFFPVKKNKVVVESYDGRGYSDEGKAICDSLLKKKSNLDIVWLVRDTSMKAPFGIRYVKLNSIKGVYELVTAKIWMDNRRKLSYVRKRKEQFYIQEWHGGGPCLKYIEKDATALPAEYVAYARNDFRVEMEN